MLAKLAELVLSAKSGAVSGALILAGGAVVSASTGAGMTFDLEQPTPTPIVEVVEVVEVEPLELELDLEDEDEGNVSPEPTEEVAELPITEKDCENEHNSRVAGQGRIDAAFKKYDKGLDELRAKLEGKGSAEVYDHLESAKALLAEIKTSALAAYEELGLCDVRVASVGQVGFRGGAAAFMEVAERAVAAMETVYNLAKATVLKEIERLKPTPKPKKTEAPKKSEKPRATKAPRCDDEMYAAKKRMYAAFEKYHGAHDKLIKQLKGWAGEDVMEPFWRTDQLLHNTFDTTKERIIAAGCATGEDSSMALAESAEILFREAYAASHRLFETVAKDKPDYDGCNDDMYAAKDVMYEAFERWHGANDKLIHGLKQFASDDAIHVAKAADELIHETFDTTKHRIIEATCNKDHEAYVFGLAQSAAAAFEAAHKNALVGVAKELAERDEDDE